MVQRGARAAFHTVIHLDPTGTEQLYRLPIVLRIRIKSPDDHPGKTVGDYRFGTRRSPPVGRTGFKSYINGCSGQLPPLIDRIVDCIYFSVSFPGFPVESPADDPALFYNNGTDHGIGIGQSPSQLGKSQSFEHKLMIGGSYQSAHCSSTPKSASA